MKFPLEKLKDIANDFGKFWNYPYCLRAIDCKETAIKTPPNSGSDQFDCRGFSSIVLMAIIEEKY